jgi:hypothetical protein
MHKKISANILMWKMLQQMMKNPQEHWQQEELVEEINLENNDGKDCHSMKEECFQDIASESRILDVVSNEEKDESILRLETPHPIKDNNILEQPRIDFIESWFQSIVGQAMQSYFEHIWFSFSSTHFGHAPDSLVLASICSSNSGVHSKDQLDA